MIAKKNKHSTQKETLNSAKEAVEKLKDLKKIDVPSEGVCITGGVVAKKSKTDNNSQPELTQETSIQKAPDLDEEVGVNQSDYVMTKLENIVLREFKNCEKDCKGFSWKLFGGIIAMLVILIGGYLLYINFRFDKVDKEISDIKNDAIFKKDINSKYLNK